MSDPSLPTGNHQMTDSASWPFWYVQFQFHALSKGLWLELDPDAPDITTSAPELPEKPTTNITEKAINAYKLETQEYRALLSDWAMKAQRLQSLWNWVNATVAPEILAPAMIELVNQEKATLKGLIIELKKELAPTEISSGIYATMRFDAHPLSNCTILDGGAALHLVNNKDLLIPGSFKKATALQSFEAGTQAFPILGTGTRVLKGVLNGARGKGTEDLTLTEVVVVEGFHLNIISEARLKLKGVWYLGLDATLRVGTLKENVVLANLRAEHHLTFLEYKPLAFYPITMSVTPARKKLRSWTTHPRTDSEELWHRRSGHLGPLALQALVKSARNVKIQGTPRINCKHCSVTHAAQVISRRARERSPRPFWTISWDLFDMPIGRAGEHWILIMVYDYSGSIL